MTFLSKFFNHSPFSRLSANHSDGARKKYSELFGTIVYQRFASEFSANFQDLSS